MGSMRQKIGWGATIIMGSLSLLSTIFYGRVDSESWIFLLLIPFTVALALTPEDDSKNSNSLVSEWSEEDEVEESPNLQAGDYGFDTPVL